MIRVMDDSEQREALLRHSLRCRRCYYVVHLVSRSVSAGSLEEALQEALQDERQGEWQTALELLDKGLKLNTKDTEFAVKSCCYLGRVDGVVELCKRFENWLLVDEALAAFAEKVCKHLVLSGIEFTFDHGKLDTLNFNVLFHHVRVISKTGQREKDQDKYLAPAGIQTHDPSIEKEIDTQKKKNEED
nr:hypothetical protein BaRGS_033017 [Batillaria attramentaria]